MTQQNAIQLFEEKQVRITWNEEEEKYYFSIVDVVQILTEQSTPRKASTYWAVLKKRLKEEGADELLTNCKQLKLPAADGKSYMASFPTNVPPTTYYLLKIRKQKK